MATVITHKKNLSALSDYELLQLAEKYTKLRMDVATNDYKAFDCNFGKIKDVKKIDENGTR